MFTLTALRALMRFCFEKRRFFCQIQCFDWGEFSIFSRLHGCPKRDSTQGTWRFSTTRNHFSGVQGVQSHLGEYGPLSADAR